MPRNAAGDERQAALVAQPCPALELGSEPIDPTRARALVEVAEVTTKNLPRPIGRWLDTHAVELRSAANLLAFPNVPTSMPWGLCVDAVCSARKLSLTVTARVPERPSEPITLALALAEAPAPGSPASAASSSKPLLHTTLELRHQEPVVLLPQDPNLTEGSIVVTAYLLRRHDDLRRLLECKVAERERVLQAR